MAFDQIRTTRVSVFEQKHKKISAIMNLQGMKYFKKQKYFLFEILSIFKNTLKNRDFSIVGVWE